VHWLCPSLFRMDLGYDPQEVGTKGKEGKV